MSQTHIYKSSERGNMAVVAVVALLIIVVGVGAYINKGKLMPQNTTVTESMDKVEGAELAEKEQDVPVEQEVEAPQTAEQKAFIKDPKANPVVAKLKGKEIKRNDVFGYIQKLPADMQQAPVQKLFPMATVQVVNAELIGKKADDANLDNDPVVKAQLEAARAQIVRGVFVQKMIDEKLTEARIKKTYEAYKAGFPAVDEVRSRHILVEDETKANELLTKLKEGGDFTTLAKENSIDPSAKENGGELSFVAKQDVVPEFAEAAFAQEVGKVSEAPVKSQFGYHIIEVLEKRQRPVPKYEEAKPFLSAQLRNVILEEVLQAWRKEEGVEVFDINGDAFEPAAGEAEPQVKEKPKQ